MVAITEAEAGVVERASDETTTHAVSVRERKK
jgi:hypothetical protein